MDKVKLDSVVEHESKDSIFDSFGVAEEVFERFVSEYIKIILDKQGKVSSSENFVKALKAVKSPDKEALLVALACTETKTVAMKFFDSLPD